MHGRSNLSARWTAPALILLLGACALPGSGDPFAAAQEGPQRVTLHVRNLNFSEVTLWAVAATGRRRLGTVGGKQDSVYSLTWLVSEPLQIEMDLLAGPRCWTEELIVDAGDILDLEIEMDVRQMYNCRGTPQS